MKKVRSVLLCVGLVLSLLGCQSEQDRIYDEIMAQTPAPEESAQPESPAPSTASSGTESEASASSRTPISYNHTPQYVNWGELFNLEPNTDISGELVVRGYHRPSIEPWVEEFKAAYPHVSVKLLIDPIEAGSSSQLLALALNAGTAGDVVMTGVVSHYKYGESGLFRDLYPFMEEDPDFHKEDYFTNTFEAAETRDGKLFTVSPAFSTSGALFNTRVTDKAGVDFLKDYPDGMSYHDIIQLRERCIEVGALDAGAPLSPLGSKDYLFTIATPDYLDEKNHTASFDSPEYLDYLKTTGSIPADLGVAYDGYGFDYDFHGTREFMILANHNMELLPMYLEGNKKMHSSVLVPCRTESGKMLFIMTCGVGITSSCENPELAWEFVKFIMSEKPFPDGPDADGIVEPAYAKVYRFGAPTNRKNFEALSRALFSDEELIQYVESVLERCNSLTFTNSELAVAWGEIRKSYYDNELISAEECAKQMQERTYIYMNE